MLTPPNDEFFMKHALAEAHKALALGEIPIGAVIVAKGQIIARAHNLCEQLKDVTAHAEMQGITAAANHLGGKYLKGCKIYVTIEPCVMCDGALFWSQIDAVIFGAKDPKREASTQSNRYHPKTKVKGGILEKECAQLLVEFFNAKRKNE